MFNNKLFSMNLFRLVHFESYQRRSVAERHVPLSAGPSDCVLNDHCEIVDRMKMRLVNNNIV